MLYDAMKDKNVIALSCHIDDITAMPSAENKKLDDYPDGRGTGPMDPCVFRQWAFSAGLARGDVTLMIPNFLFQRGEFDFRRGHLRILHAVAGKLSLQAYQ